MDKEFIRNFNFIKAVILVHLKSIKEYKSNLYMGILANIMFVTILNLY